VRVKPTIPATMRRRRRRHCARGHDISGYNAMPCSRRGATQCRACHVTNLWARHHNLFYDDPRVAAALIARYRDMAVTR